MHSWNRNLPLQQCLGYLRRPLSGYAHFEDVFNHIGCNLIHDPAVLVLRIFEIAIRWIGTQRLTRFALGLEHRSDLLAGVLGVPFVDDIEERGKIAVLLIGTVYAVVDGDEADISAGQNYLGVVTHLEVISAQSAHVLDNDSANLTLVHKGHQALPIRAVKVGSGVAIVHEEHGVAETVAISVLLQNGFLVDNGVAVTLQLIITGQAAVQGGDLNSNRLCGFLE